MQQRVEVGGIDHGYRFLLGSHALIYQVACDLESGLCRPLAVTCLEHEQLAVLYGELHILHIAVVILQRRAYGLELCKCLRELLLHLGDMHRCTDTGYDVLALCIGQELAEQTLGARSGITGKCNTRTAVIAHIAECHGLYVDCCTP